MFPNMQRAYGVQPYTAKDRIDELALTQKGEYLTEITTGVTIPELGGDALVAHFCSSRLKLIKTNVHGNGIPVPYQPPDQPVIFKDGLFRFPMHSIVRFKGIITLGSKIEISIADPRALFVAIPSSLLDDDPWAWEGGCEQVARTLGFRSLESLFRSKFVQYALAA